jgi:hypothetical protein
MKLEQWEEENRQLTSVGIPNPYDAYPNYRSKNWLQSSSKLVIKDRVAVIVFNNKETEKLDADIKEKNACAESSGMAGHVRGVSNYQYWKYAWPQHASMYRKRKRTRTDASIDKEKIKEEIKQELKAEMQNDLLAMLG